jgi:hypothetical protein
MDLTYASAATSLPLKSVRARRALVKLRDWTVPILTIGDLCRFEPEDLAEQLGGIGITVAREIVEVVTKCGFKMGLDLRMRLEKHSRSECVEYLRTTARLMIQAADALEGLASAADAEQKPAELSPETAD